MNVTCAAVPPIPASSVKEACRRTHVGGASHATDTAWNDAARLSGRSAATAAGTFMSIGLQPARRQRRRPRSAGARVHAMSGSRSHRTADHDHQAEMGQHIGTGQRGHRGRAGVKGMMCGWTPARKRRGFAIPVWPTPSTAAAHHDRVRPLVRAGAAGQR
jgi:hypothetical protein